jgi:GTPase SAR1 family protein
MNPRASLKGTPTKFSFDTESTKRRSMAIARTSINHITQVQDDDQPNDGKNSNKNQNEMEQESEEEYETEYNNKVKVITAATPNTAKKTPKTFKITPRKSLAIQEESPVRSNDPINFDDSNFAIQTTPEKSKQTRHGKRSTPKPPTPLQTPSTPTRPLPELIELHRSPQLQHIGASLHPKSPSVVRFRVNDEEEATSTKTQSKLHPQTSSEKNNSKNVQEEALEETYYPTEDEEFLSSLEWVTRRPVNPIQPLSAQYKVLILGNACCGKSSIVQRYTQGTFSENYTTTIGADYSRKLIKMKNDDQIGLQLFDIAGQERFNQGLSRTFTRHARAAVVVFDITRPETFDAVREWKKQLDFHFFIENDDNEDGKNVAEAQSNLPTMFPLILLMNKCDLLTKNVNGLLSMGAKLEKLKNELGFTAAFTTSAKDSVYIAETFDFLSDLLYKQDIARKVEYYKKFHPNRLSFNQTTQSYTILGENDDGGNNDANNDINKLISEAHADPRARKEFYNKGHMNNRPKRVDLNQKQNPSQNKGGCC